MLASGEEACRAPLGVILRSQGIYEFLHIRCGLARRGSLDDVDDRTAHDRDIAVRRDQVKPVSTGDTEAQRYRRLDRFPDPGA